MIPILLLVVIGTLAGFFTWSRRQAGGERAAGGPRGRPELDRWVEAGLISRAQATAIAAFEQRAAGASRRVSLATEALGYVGAVLGVAGGGIALGNVWEDLDDWARPAILGGTALALLAGGGMIRRQEEPALRRLTSVLWFLSVGALAATSALLFVDFVKRSDELSVLGTGAAVALYAGTLWLLQRRVLQQLALLAGLIVTLVGGLLLLPGEVPSWVFAVAVWGLGGAWAVLGWRKIVEPWWAALPLGALTALVAPAVGADEFGWLFVVALGTAGGLIAASVALRMTPLLGPGAIGMFAYVTWAVVKYFGEALGVPVALALAGAVVLALALVAGRSRRLWGRPGPRGPVGLPA